MAGASRPVDPPHEGTLHRRRYRDDVARCPGPRRHGLRGGDRRRPALPRRPDRADLRRHERHPGRRPRPDASWRCAAEASSATCSTSAPQRAPAPQRSTGWAPSVSVCPRPSTRPALRPPTSSTSARPTRAVLLASSTPYLRLLGTTVCAGLLAKAAIAAGEIDDAEFAAAKQASARFFGEADPADGRGSAPRRHRVGRRAVRPVARSARLTQGDPSPSRPRAPGIGCPMIGRRPDAPCGGAGDAHLHRIPRRSRELQSSGPPTVRCRSQISFGDGRRRRAGRRCSRGASRRAASPPARREPRLGRAGRALRQPGRGVPSVRTRRSNAGRSSASSSAQVTARPVAPAAWVEACLSGFSIDTVAARRLGGSLVDEGDGWSTDAGGRPRTVRTSPARVGPGCRPDARSSSLPNMRGVPAPCCVLASDAARARRRAARRRSAPKWCRSPTQVRRHRRSGRCSTASSGVVAPCRRSRGYRRQPSSRSPYAGTGRDRLDRGRNLVARALADTADPDQIRPDEFEIVELARRPLRRRAARRDRSVVATTMVRRRAPLGPRSRSGRRDVGMVERGRGQPVRPDGVGGRSGRQASRPARRCSSSATPSGPTPRSISPPTAGSTAKSSRVTHVIAAGYHVDPTRARHRSADRSAGRPEPS